MREVRAMTIEIRAQAADSYLRAQHGHLMISRVRRALKSRHGIFLPMPHHEHSATLRDDRPSH